MLMIPVMCCRDDDDTSNVLWRCWWWYQQCVVEMLMIPAMPVLEPVIPYWPAYIFCPQDDHTILTSGVYCLSSRRSYHIDQWYILSVLKTIIPYWPVVYIVCPKDDHTIMTSGVYCLSSRQSYHIDQWCILSVLKTIIPYWPVVYTILTSGVCCLSSRQSYHIDQWYILCPQRVRCCPWLNSSWSSRCIPQWSSQPTDRLWRTCWTSSGTSGQSASHLALSGWWSCSLFDLRNWVWSLCVIISSPVYCSMLDLLDKM